MSHHVPELDRHGSTPPQCADTRMKEEGSGAFGRPSAKGAARVPAEWNSVKAKG